MVQEYYCFQTQTRWMVHNLEMEDRGTDLGCFDHSVRKLACTTATRCPQDQDRGQDLGCFDRWERKLACTTATSCPQDQDRGQGRRRGF